MSGSLRARACPALAGALLLGLLPGWGSASSAAASLAAETTVTPTTTTVAAAATGATTTLAGLSVANSAGASTLQTVVSTTRGTLTFPETSGLTLALGYSWSGDDEVGFIGSPAAINAALDDVQLVGTGTRGAAEVEIVAFAPRTGLAYSPSTGHYYEYVASNAVTWTAARDLAKARTLQGQAGYLATVPNDEVNALLAGRVQGAERAWIGGTAVNTPSATIKRTWSWADGPLAGQVFTQCTNSTNPCAVVATTAYSSWKVNEPNNFGGAETAAAINYGELGKWNDFPPGNGSMKGYLVEYGDLPFGSTTDEEQSATATSTVTMAEAPGPVTSLSATPGDGSAQLSFGAPTDDGGSAVTGYEVKVGDGAWTPTSGPTSHTVTGLTNGTPATISVRAVNALGAGAAQSVDVTPVAPPPPPELAVTAPSNSLVPASGTTRLTGLGISKREAPATQKFQVTVSTTRGTLSLTLPAGVTLAYGNQASGTSSVTMIGTLAKLNAALATVDLVGDGTRGTATIAISGTSALGLTYNPSNQHFYQYVSGRKTWPQAKIAAEARTYQGLQGYLATIPDQATNDLIRDKVADANFAWIGLKMVDTRSTGIPRTYVWDAGPLADQVVTACKPFVGPCVRQDPQTAFTSWKDYEPNNDQNRERRVVINWTGPNLPRGRWNDVATDWGSAQGYVVEYGDLPVGSTAGPDTASASADLLAADAPASVTSLESTAGDGTATITFAAPGDDGGSPITGYEVKVGDGAWQSIGTDTTYTATGLTNGTPVEIAVRAVNAVGAGNPSATTVTPQAPVTVPGAVVNLTGAPGDNTAFASWEPPASDGGSPITGYEIKGTDEGGWEPVGLVLTAGIGGPPNGEPFKFFVRAVNAVGPGPESFVVVTPRGVPGAPTGAAAKAGNASATVTFGSADGNGAAVTSYVVTATPPTGAATTNQCAASPCTVTGLVNGRRYAITVAAVNEAGAGAAAAAGSVVPRATPAANAPELSGGDREFTVTWDPIATSPSTSPVRSWQVGYVDNVGVYRWFNVSPTTTDGGRLTTLRTGVFNGRAYDVSVRPLYASGLGPASPSTSITLAHWFADPLTSQERAALIDVPERPGSVTGAVQRTKAYLASKTGLPAMRLADLAGRQVQKDQAVWIPTDGLFAPGTAALTDDGRAAVAAMNTSLRYVGSLTCEVYVDHGTGLTGQQAISLSAQRGESFCDAMKNTGYNGGFNWKGYGSSWPAVVGGATASRSADNNRIVVRIVQN